MSDTIIPSQLENDIRFAIEATGSIAFNGWHNQKLKGPVCALLEAMSFQSYCPERTQLMATALTTLASSVAESVERDLRDAQEIANRIVYERGGPLYLKPPTSVNTSFWESIKALESRRMEVSNVR